MRTYPALSLTMVAMFFLVGYGQVTRSTYAADPDPCDQYECKNVLAFWNGSPTSVLGFKTNATPAVPLALKWGEVFTPVSREKNDPDSALFEYCFWSFPSCTPLCGKDGTHPNLRWQADQEVTVAVVGKKDGEPLSWFKCKATTGNVIGPKITPSANRNTAGNAPPQSKTGD